MAFYASDIVKIATKQLGYHEKNNDSALYGTAAGSGNHTKYAKELHAAGFFNADKCGYDWCAVFVTWCAYQLTGSRDKAMHLLCQTGPYGAGCTQARSYYKSAGRYDRNPKIGDQVIFNNGTSLYVHTGIVIQVSDSYITTIEGNSANMVAQRTYKRNDSNIDGYGHPRYDAEPVKTESEVYVNVNVRTIKYGSSGNDVKTLQAVLKAEGFYKSTVDGDFGDLTQAALKQYQKKHGLTVDGWAGSEVWSFMLKK